VLRYDHYAERTEQTYCGWILRVIKFHGSQTHPKDMGLPVVMTQDEVRRVLAEMHGTHLRMAKLLYTGGLRLMECVRLRVQDLDFAMGLVTIQ
jgi:integrase